MDLFVCLFQEVYIFFKVSIFSEAFTALPSPVCPGVYPDQPCMHHRPHLNNCLNQTCFASDRSSFHKNRLKTENRTKRPKPKTWRQTLQKIYVADVLAHLFSRISEPTNTQGLTHEELLKNTIHHNQFVNFHSAQRHSKSLSRTLQLLSDLIASPSTYPGRSVSQ